MLQPPLEDWERPKVIFPSDNPDTDASVELGGALFFETLMSKDSSISCQSCHLMTQAFADHLPVGEGILKRTVTRNTPSLTNIGLHPYFMADGKFGTLEEQVLGPINEHREFDMTPEEVVARLKTVPLYNELSMKAYNQELNIDVVQKALANFQRVIVSQDSRFDLYMKNEIELTPEEKAGWKLFNNSELNCIQCHGGYNFTNYAFENNGLYANPTDSGRALITELNDDIAKFKVPSLRNISITYPYMHDGTFQSLGDVIDHYASGGQNHVNQSELINGFQITAAEKKALIAFLKTLTEDQYLDE
jgi:cytochrome c peroxidase